MVKKRLALVMVLAGVLLAGGVTCLFADKGVGVIMAHPVDQYPNCVRDFDTDRTVVYTKDSLDKVKTFFQEHTQSGDKFETLQEAGEQGLRLNYHAVIDGKEQVVMELELSERAPVSTIHEALGALKTQTMMGHHTEQEYQAVAKKYGNLIKAYYRHVDDGNGGSMTEDSLICKRASKQAYTDADKQKAAKASSEFGSNKARAQDLKTQMKALKAKGDVAGMLKLMQQNKMTSTQSKAVQDSMEVGTKDNWDVWVKCLEECEAAAYWTKIKYNANAATRQQ